MEFYLKAINLRKSYQRRKVVDDVSIEVKKGEIVGLLGPNGAGKTTTFSLILGLIPQDSGQIYLNGEDITSLPMYLRAQKGIGLLPQEPSAFRKLSVEENLLSIMETIQDSHPKENLDLVRILREFGLEKVAKAKAYTLSGGERRRLEIARAMVPSPAFILLDEPFTGIDPLATQDIQKLIVSLKEKGMGLLLTDHSVRETLKVTDRAYIMNNGRILKEGVPQELINSEEVRRTYLGENFDLY